MKKEYYREITINKEMIVGDEPMNDYVMQININCQEFPDVDKAKNISFYGDKALTEKLRAKLDDTSIDPLFTYWVEIPKLHKEADTKIYIHYEK